MKVENKYWEILLINWREKGRDGFSLPFLIGSQQYLANNTNQNIKELITDIIENSNHEIYIAYCMNINDLVLGIRDVSKQKISGSFPKFKNKPQSKFFLTNFLNDLGQNAESIIDKLTVRYERQINSKKYSINNHIISDYNVTEIEFIKSSLKKISLR